MWTWVSPGLPDGTGESPRKMGSRPDIRYERTIGASGAGNAGRELVVEEQVARMWARSVPWRRGTVASLYQI